MSRLGLILLIVVFCVALGPVQADITSPGDAIKGLPIEGDPDNGNQNWPAGEAPPNVIDDNVNTKYLHFLGEKQPTGFAVTPSQSGRIVGGLTFTTANDDARRDPVKYELYGSNTSIDGPWTFIAAGDIVDFAQTAEWPRLTKNSTPIRFVNTQPYDHYMVMFPLVRNPAGANSMQIAEVELLEAPLTGWPPEVNAGGSYLVRLPNTLQLNATVTDFDTPAEQLSFEWRLYSGPAAVDFGGTEGDLDATVAFTEKGVYQFELQVSDGVNDANDVATVRVWDPATDDALLAHWSMNDGEGSSIVTDNSGNGHHGVIGSHEMGTDPNWAPGWIPADEPDNWALNFYQYGYVEVVPDVNAPSPNLNDVQYMISIAAWFNSRGWTGNHRILQKGLEDNQFRLLVEGNQLRFHLAGAGDVRGPLPTLNLWHHVAATYDGAALRLYLDGVQVASSPATGLINTSGDPLYIGTKSKFVDPSAHPGDYFTGMIDDVWIFNYALSEDEILDLIAMGENAPPAIIDIDAPAELVLSVSNSVDIDATVFDVNGDAINYQWTAVGPGTVTFIPSADVEDPTVAFDAAGTYTLRLAIDDGMFGLEGNIYREVVIAVTNPTCADVIAAGLGLFGDSNGDCRIDMADLAAFAENWLVCNDPLVPGCVNPFAR